MKPVRKEDRALLDTYKNKTCLVCNRFGCDPCHIRSRGAGGPDEAWNLMPTCRQHHTEQHQIGIVTFMHKYASVAHYLKRMGWVVEQEAGRSRLWNPLLKNFAD